MKYLSVCSGIEAATVAWHPLGWKPVAFSEIEPFPSAVLAHHYPEVPNVGDMTNYKEWNLGAVDILVGGTPCQSFSVAGLRRGLEDPRGNLALVYCGILDHYRPKWFIWENVPGVLSSNGGRDFGSFLGALAELGYGFAYRVLDAQFFGVAQRRRRVFVVGHLGDWRPAAEVLFESDCLRRDTAPSRQARKKVASSAGAGAPFGGMSPVAGTLTANTGGMTRPAGNANELDFCVPTYAIQGSMIGRSDDAGPQGDGINEEVCFTQNCGDRHAVATPVMTMAHGQGGAEIATDRAPTLTCNHEAPIAAYSQPMPINTMVALRHEALGKGTGFGIGEAGDPAYTLTKGHSHAVAQPMVFGVGEQPHLGHCLRAGASKADKHESTTYVEHAMQVRRLTPVECERLQGFPDNYTAIPWRKKQVSECPDGPRYKALGNSMATPVMRWIGERIQQQESKQ